MKLYQIEIVAPERGIDGETVGDVTVSRIYHELARMQIGDALVINRVEDSPRD